MTEAELEERITDQMDRERVADAILALEIKQLKEAVERVEQVSNIQKGGG